MYGWRKKRPWTPRKSEWPTRLQATNISGGAQPAALERPLFNLVVRRFTRDDHVVHVAFAQARDSDAHEAGAFLQLGKRRYAAVAHSAFEPPDQLVRQRSERTFVRDAAFDTLRDGLSSRRAFLCIEIG